MTMRRSGIGDAHIPRDENLFEDVNSTKYLSSTMWTYGSAEEEVEARISSDLAIFPVWRNSFGLSTKLH